VIGGTAPAVDGVVVAGSRVEVDSGCNSVAALITATRKATVVRAHWPRCGSLQKVRLRGRMAAPACTTMTGTLSAKHHKPVAFQAVRSTCGDGVVDPGAGEECESDVACGLGRQCVGCRCADRETMVTTTTVPRQLSVCGDGVVEPGEPCDLLASPSGCPPGQECDLQADHCQCNPVPGTIGHTVSFDPGPIPNPVSLGLPTADDGTFLLMTLATGVQLEIPASVADPITAMGRCAGWIVACVSPPDRSLDDCARSAPACTTSQPWLETLRCCPVPCFTAYESLRLAGVAPLLAFQIAYFDDASCFPGVRQLLGE
jgi:hypothetical protein